MDLGRDQAIQTICSQIAQRTEETVGIQGTWGSFGPLLVSHLFKQVERPILFIRAHIEDAHKAVDDLLTFETASVDCLPAWEGEEEYADATDEIRAARLTLAIKLAGPQTRTVICAPIQALCQPVPKIQTLTAGALTFQVDRDMDPHEAAQRLVDNGFEPVDRIDVPGQFARRGGILDIFAPVTAGYRGSSQEALALRVEFFGDTVESVRRINLDTHRSADDIHQIQIVSATAGTGSQDNDLFVGQLPPETLVIFEEPAECQEVATVLLDRVDDPSRLYPWDAVHGALAQFQQVHLSRFASTVAEPVRLEIHSIQQVQQKTVSTWAGHKQALETLIQRAQAENLTVQLFCESTAELSRVKEIVQEIKGKVPRQLKLVKGFLHQGFEIVSLQCVCVSHHELFGQNVLRRQTRPMRVGAPVDSLADLVAGDYVVHASYGLGKFLGTEIIEENSTQSEYLTLEYADAVKIHVAISNITLIQKYIGTSPKRPKLSKVGSKKWQKQKDKVAESVRDLAVELLQVQAVREATGGILFEPDSHWQREFEESFPYQETADQTTAIEQIKTDMQRSVAMDRLLCGDVGYGKTEVAMRAAFKAVENGKQVAVLVPTTVLCVQHGRTFAERFADFPVSIDVLNRFRSPGQCKQILEWASQGKVDILIGTHRLVSKDVAFKDLGLLIIDEEQRFGVEHKERLKRMRVDVDILTMSATPIPRTLHMSLLGLRDISSLSTPPLDRRSVVTRIAQFNHQAIRKAIVQELNRGGQVFYLHNRVKSIDKMAMDIRKLIKDTDATVMVAHGQMAKKELEDAMIRFVQGEVQVLVCTTIIESGLDIPNANTIIIDNADRFGLAELHQLRGRVGRYRHRAYAYMLLPEKRSINPVAAKRLKAIEEYSHLGAGFRIALRDLEIRGAGNILGAEQSGHIQLVGYQMYCEMLAEAVRKLKNEPLAEVPKVSLDLGFSTYIPKEYIQSERQRMDVYRRIATCHCPKALADMAEELADVYGDVPEHVDLFLDMARVRLAAGQYGITSITVSRKHLVFTFKETPGDQAHGLFARINGKVRIPNPQTVAVGLLDNYFEPATLMMLLRKMFNPARSPRRSSESQLTPR
ncbi:MAG: transcription-repair coupling factor [Phycisphaeraceae bacterium]|nr:transcription-repair coupling factor [Phycisphaeraceae bacterium]